MKNKTLAFGLMTAGLGLLGCDSDPPHDDGYFWQCGANVTVNSALFPGFPIITIDSASSNFSFSICANIDVPEQEIKDECKDECEDHFSSLSSIFVSAKCDESPECLPGSGSKISIGSATCSLTEEPIRLNTPCNTADQLLNILQSGQWVGSLSTAGGPLSELSVTIDGETKTTGITGRVGYAIALTETTCPAEGCDIVLSALNFSAGDVAIGGATISGLKASSTALITGKWFPNTCQSGICGYVFFAKENFAIQTNFAINGVAGSMRSLPDDNVYGLINPDTNAFALYPITVTAPDGAQLSVTLNATLIARPPHAVIADKPVFTECTADGFALVSLDGSQSSDPDGDLRTDALWGLERNGEPFQIAQVMSPTVLLPLGTNKVILDVFDRRGAFDADVYTTAVIDTVAPSVTCDDVKVECAGAQTPVSTSCLADDVCDSALDVTSDATNTYPPGTHTFTCVATDDAGNTNDDTCFVRVVDETPPVITPSPTTTLNECNSDPHLVTLPFPTVTDACGQGSPLLTGTVVKVNGKTLATPIAIPSDGKLLLRPGTVTVRWMASDVSGNTTSIEQSFTIAVVQGTACCKQGQTITQGTSGQDSIVKSSGSHCVLGLASGDFIQTASGSDLLVGGTGADNLTGGGGQDVLYGGADADMVSCGYGGTYEAHGEAGDDNVQAVFCSSAQIWGGPGTDTLSGSPGADKIYPGSGVDSVDGSGGNDLVTLFHECEAVSGKSLVGGAGQDTLVTPLSLSALASRGVTVSGFETVTVDASKGYLADCF